MRRRWCGRNRCCEFAGTNDRAKDFFARFVDNCDLRGTTLTQFFKQQITEALVCGKSYIAVDFPQSDGPARSRADEDASGRSRAYLVSYNADELINWSHSDQGELDWVVIRTSCLKQDSVKSFGWKSETHVDLLRPRKFRDLRAARSADQTNTIELIDKGGTGSPESGGCRCSSCA